MRIFYRTYWKKHFNPEVVSFKEFMDNKMWLSKETKRRLLGGKI